MSEILSGDFPVTLSKIGHMRVKRAENITRPPRDVDAIASAARGRDYV